MKLRLAIVMIVLSSAFSLLFSLSEVNFKMEYLQISSLIRNFFEVGIPVLISGFITYCINMKAQKNTGK